MKKEHDEITAITREESYSKIWFVKALELLKRQGISFKNVIDIGAGKGEFLEVLKSRFNNLGGLYGVDYIESNLEILRRKNINSIRIDLDNFEVRDFEFLKGKFDLVTCLETTEHIFNLDRLFMFFNYLLSEKGHLLITTPNMASFHARLFYLLRGYPFGENHHVRFLNKRKLRQYTFFNGFDPVGWRNYFTFQLDVIRRGFGLRKNFWVYLIGLLFFGPLLLFRKLNMFDSWVSSGLVVLYEKGEFVPLGLEVHNFRKNFESLPTESKNLWVNRMRRYYQKDKLGEHIYLRSYVEGIIRER